MARRAVRSPSEPASSVARARSLSVKAGLSNVMRLTDNAERATHGFIGRAGASDAALPTPPTFVPEGTMFRTIIVPLDGSAFAEQALPVALRIAGRAAAELHVVEAHVPYLLEGVDTGKWENTVRERERTYLAGVAERVAAVDKHPPRASLVGPDPVKSVGAYVGRFPSPLVVMTSHGRTGLSRLWLGSVADGLVRSAVAPVLLVRPSEGAPEPLGGGGVPFSRILVPLDGSERAERVLEHVATLAGLGGAEVRLVRVVEPVAELVAMGLDYVEPIYPADLTDAEVVRAQEYIEGAAARIRNAPGVGVVTTEVRVARRVGAALLETVERWKPDLVALATHGRGASRLLIGSTADKMLRGASAPVLVVRAGDRPTAEQRAADESGVEAMMML